MPASGASPTSRRKNHNKVRSPAYNAQQLAPCILEDASNEANINSMTIAPLAKIKGTYRRQPPYTQYRTVRKELYHYLSIPRAVNIASLERYAGLLKESGHHVELIIMSKPEMKPQRIKSARHKFRQCQKAKSLPKEATFQEEIVDVSDLNDDSCLWGLCLSRQSRSTSATVVVKRPQKMQRTATGGTKKLRDHI